MAGYIVLRRLFKEQDQPLRKERVFRDRSQALDTLNDQELISRYRFPSHVIWRLVDLVKQGMMASTRAVSSRSLQLGLLLTSIMVVTYNCCCRRLQI